jgi:HEAT repeat protein
MVPMDLLNERRVNMTLQSTVITIPEVKLTVDQLLKVVRQLDEASRIQVAQVLVETEMDTKLANLIEQLAKTRPADDISDENIEDEIKAVRNLGG